MPSALAFASLPKIAVPSRALFAAAAARAGCPPLPAGLATAEFAAGGANFFNQFKVLKILGLSSSCYQWYQCLGAKFTFLLPVAMAIFVDERRPIVAYCFHSDYKILYTCVSTNGYIVLMFPQERHFVPGFRVTKANETEVRAYLARLVADRSRLAKAIHWRTDPQAAGDAYREAENAGELPLWIAHYLSPKGRTRMLTAFRQQRCAKDRANWRLSKSLFDQVKRASKMAGFASPEAWLAARLLANEASARRNPQKQGNCPT